MNRSKAFSSGRNSNGFNKNVNPKDRATYKSAVPVYLKTQPAQLDKASPSELSQKLKYFKSACSSSSKQVTSKLKDASSEKKLEPPNHHRIAETVCATSYKSGIKRRYEKYMKLQKPPIASHCNELDSISQTKAYSSWTKIPNHAGSPNSSVKMSTMPSKSALAPMTIKQRLWTARPPPPPPAKFSVSPLQKTMANRNKVIEGSPLKKSLVAELSCNADVPLKCPPNTPKTLNGSQKTTSRIFEPLNKQSRLNGRCLEKVKEQSLQKKEEKPIEFADQEFIKTDDGFISQPLRWNAWQNSRNEKLKTQEKLLISAPSTKFKNLGETVEKTVEEGERDLSQQIKQLHLEQNKFYDDCWECPVKEDSEFLGCMPGMDAKARIKLPEEDGAREQCRYHAKTESELSHSIYNMNSNSKAAEGACSETVLQHRNKNEEFLNMNPKKYQDAALPQDFLHNEKNFADSETNNCKCEHSKCEHELKTEQKLLKELHVKDLDGAFIDNSKRKNEELPAKHKKYLNICEWIKETEATRARSQIGTRKSPKNLCSNFVVPNLENLEKLQAEIRGAEKISNVRIPGCEYTVVRKSKETVTPHAYPNCKPFPEGENSGKVSAGFSAGP